MKKGIAAVLMVLAAVLIGLSVAYHYIEGQQNQVYVTETALAGDPKAAEGINLNFKACDSDTGKLFWNIDHIVSDESKTKAQFQKVKDGHYDVFWTQPYVDIESDLFYSSSPFDYSPASKEIAKDVAKRTQNSQTHEETHLLRDYYEYYPVNLNIQFPGYYVNDAPSDVQYFKIPVPDKYTIDVSVTKNQAGEITSYDVTSPYTSLNIPGQNIFTTSGCYLVLDKASYELELGEDVREISEKWEIDLPEDMRGIHFIPFAKSVEGSRFLNIDLAHARMAYPLSSDCRVMDLRLSADEKKLLLLTQEKAAVYLSVIDKESMELQQKIFLFQENQEIWVLTMSQENGRLLTIFDDGQFYLFTQKGNQYHMELSDNLHQVDALSEIKLREPFLSFDYDGKSLALAAYDADDSYYEDLTTSYLCLFDKEGLQYAGCYRSSLGRKKASTNGVVPAITFYRKNDTLPKSASAIKVKL